MTIFDRIRDALDKNESTNKLIELGKEALDHVNNLRGLCFETFTSEMLLKKDGISNVIFALLTIRPSCYVSENQYNIVTYLIQRIDPNETVRSKASTELWIGLQAKTPLDVKKYKVCGKCSRPQSTKKCSKCKLYYCSITCQTDDWPEHKNVCKVIDE